MSKPDEVTDLRLRPRAAEISRCQCLPIHWRLQEDGGTAGYVDGGADALHRPGAEAGYRAPVFRADSGDYGSGTGAAYQFRRRSARPFCVRSKVKRLHEWSTDRAVGGVPSRERKLGCYRWTSPTAPCASQALNLRPMYRQTTNHGHFGKPELPWETHNGHGNETRELRQANRSVAIPRNHQEEQPMPNGRRLQP